MPVYLTLCTHVLQNNETWRMRLSIHSLLIRYACSAGLRLRGDQPCMLYPISHSKGSDAEPLTQASAILAHCPATYCHWASSWHQQTQYLVPHSRHSHSTEKTKLISICIPPSRRKKLGYRFWSSHRTCRATRYSCWSSDNTTYSWSAAFLSSTAFSIPVNKVN